MPEKPIQDFLFQRIKEILLPGRTLVDEVADALHVSQDSAYRRIRGETPLVLEEARTLCQQYHISLDQLLTNIGPSIVFQNIEVDAGANDFKNYLAGILQRLQLLQIFNEKTIIYQTKDLPLFYQFACRPLFAFRYFFWMKAVFRHPDFIQKKFSTACLPPECEALGKEVISAYCEIPSDEIWNLECINSILYQVGYCCEAGFMTKDDAIEIYSGLSELLQHLQLQAEHGRKFLPGNNHQSKRDNYNLFYNRIGLGDNTILVLYGGNKMLYHDYESLNYLITTDEVFCNQVYNKMKGVMRSSTLISSGSEKQRNIFFNLLYSKLPLPKTHKEKRVS